MSAHGREAVEAEIGRILLEQWDPLGTRAAPDPGGYAPYAHEVYNLLARGASDVQIARRLHQAERDELHHPELADRDLAPMVRALRALERQL
jgi:DNA-binding NarL/FixJ family response regulator